MTSNKEFGWLEAKQSGGAVYEQGVRQSKEVKAIRRIAEPLMEKHWKDSVVNLHRICAIRTALGAFYNHSDQPNCKNVAGFWHQLPVKYLITTKTINPGDELTAAYSLYKDFSDKWE